MNVLSSHLDGWRSDDGYHLTIRRGAYSKRLIGELVTPDGEKHALAMTRKESANDLLLRAERGVVSHRRGGRIR